MTNSRPPMTHAAGASVSDNLNIMTAGPRGPALLQDIWLTVGCGFPWEAADAAVML
jgi:catalase